MRNNFQYNDHYKQVLTNTNKKIDKIIKEKRQEGVSEYEIAKLQQQRFLAPLFDMNYIYQGRFGNPW